CPTLSQRPPPPACRIVLAIHTVPCSVGRRKPWQPTAGRRQLPIPGPSSTLCPPLNQKILHLPALLHRRYQPLGLLASCCPGLPIRRSIFRRDFPALKRLALTLRLANQGVQLLLQLCP